ncbi:bis-aminopropyl spermidine synthase family protein [Aneurinibacillus thermoaerophilus]|uniref:bis-aminopropyl spermidine synthase family protein n=1 Tax=Aneurinibacillus thermoaerophilus TaxID=143495 RepID=UPI002E210549|nr:bis-aminopropyl spermidine synthase family protein [Aneurinibacillus thermoaerophilus]MED0761002.1 bis-aminopropyl spermidine synthase family protein [Aneurinibacillus thermoaerophilus]
MKNYIEQANANVRLQEGSRVIEQLLVECYIRPGISTKELARKTLLPVPVATAIKKELMQAGALTQDRGVHCTHEGVAYIENELGYGGLDKALYQKLMVNETDWKTELADILSLLTELFQLRPQVNVQIDQSKCTPETSLRRAILCLREHALIGKQALCVGDDDLVSVSLGFLLKRLFPNIKNQKAAITVVDIDKRFLRYIRDIADRKGIAVTCHYANLRQPLSEQLHGQYDCFFTDPPYTLQGMTLFVSRGISALKKEKGLPIFLSFAHKSPDFMLALQREFVRMGLSLKEMISHFNEYEGAQMIGNRGQMIVLKTTELTSPDITGSFEDVLYTGEVKRTIRTYQCKQCNGSILVGIQGDFPTIEELKNQRCPDCGNDTFILIAKKIV